MDPAPQKKVPPPPVFSLDNAEVFQFLFTPRHSGSSTDCLLTEMLCVRCCQVCQGRSTPLSPHTHPRPASIALVLFQQQLCQMLHQTTPPPPACCYIPSKVRQVTGVRMCYFVFFFHSFAGRF